MKEKEWGKSSSPPKKNIILFKLRFVMFNEQIALNHFVVFNKNTHNQVSSDYV